MNSDSTITVHKNGVLIGTLPSVKGVSPIAFRAKVPLPSMANPASLDAMPVHALPPGATVATWAELHRYRPTAHLSQNRAWMAHFTNRLPPGPCDCRVHWIALLNTFPPDFSTDEKWFEWSVEAHNRVNLKIGKAVMSLAEATRMWRV